MFFNQAEVSTVSAAIEWDCFAAIAIAGSIIKDRDLVAEYNEAYDDEPFGDVDEELVAIGKSILTGKEDSEWANELLQDVNLHRLVQFEEFF